MSGGTPSPPPPAMNPAADGCDGAVLFPTLLPTTPATRADAPPHPRVGLPPTVSDTMLRRPFPRPAQAAPAVAGSTPLIQVAAPEGITCGDSTARRRPSPCAPPMPNPSLMLSLVMLNYLAAGFMRDCMARLLVFMAQLTLVIRPSGETVAIR